MNRIAHHGQRFTVAFAKETSGICPAFDFFESLPTEDKAKLMRLFQRVGDHEKFFNAEKFGNLGDGLYEFKSFQIRMPFAYAKNPKGWILITHGFYKKKDKTPDTEIERAWRIYKEDQSPSGLTVVKKGRT